MAIGAYRSVVFTLVGAGLLAGPVSARQQDSTVDPAASVAIGKVDGAEEYVLPNVIDGTVLSDGTIVLGVFLQGRGSEFSVRYYDSNGEHITSVGRFGDGPFELSAGFVSIDRIAGDSVMIVSLDHRYVVFGPRGEEGRTGRLTLPPFSWPLSGLPGQRVLVQTRSVVDGREESTGINQYRYGYAVQGLSGDDASPLPLRWIERTALDGGVFLNLPFEAIGYHGVGGGLVWLGHSATPELTAYTPNGEEYARVTLQMDPRPIGRREVRQWSENDLEGVAGERRRTFQRHHGRVDFPDTMPLFQSLAVSGSGRLWVLLYEPPWVESPYVFALFDREGTPRGTVTVPFTVLGPRIRRTGSGLVTPLLDVGDDYLLVEDEGPWGEPVVRRYELIRGEGR